jgi:mannose-1-phosphate guanylyltransferase/phosphomannomutase
MRQAYDLYFSYSHRVPCPWSRKGQVMRLLITDTERKNRQLIDGVRFQEDGCWVLVAPDRNEASFVVFAESEDKTKAEEIATTYRHNILKWQQ